MQARELSEAAGGARAALASGAQLAMGRVVGSLCVVTARDDESNGAMLASWISQVLRGLFSAAFCCFLLRLVI